ncbi:hypothetical protein [Candidatus Stoquefichus massiliensis]|uniref:hypothetical protein n=1 Tax=Candidatus Stoquefichus massiliensis TaxID=1470350 RepID=UPI0004836068|nr:hypothetical protein [Candidatus Stoquefichus massiliensis]
MWTYTDIIRKEFEMKKDYVEQILIDFGARPLNISLPHQVSCHGNEISDTIVSTRTVYKYQNQYYRVCEVLFPTQPFIVIEWADDIQQVMNNTMEDTDPFPWDLSDEDMTQEIINLLKDDYI